MDIAISVKNLSKKYRLYDSPQHRLKEALHPFRKKYHRDFWALRDVSFEVKKGETVGIIGRNGSGKSTLLQLICGTVTPTEGEIKVNGRMAALLELGAGFNPEFTGRDNVYMNTAIIGLSREEVDARFDEIAAFADIGNFIEQPVRIYSSGMYVRLAFAVAVCVDPQILIIDEALSVGDARFQKKCFDRMNSFKEGGRTIILVSHAPNILKTFPSKGMFIDGGRIRYLGDPVEAVLKYMQTLFPEEQETQKNMNCKRASSRKTADEASAGNLKSEEIDEGYCLEVVPNETDLTKCFGAGGAQLDWVRIYGLKEPNVFCGGETIKIEVLYSWDINRIKDLLLIHRVDCNLLFGIRLENKNGVILTNLATMMLGTEANVDPIKYSSCILNYTLRMPRLAGNDYFLSPQIAIGRQQEDLVHIMDYYNLVHLHCIPNDKYVFGLMNWDYTVNIKRME